MRKIAIPSYDKTDVAEMLEALEKDRKNYIKQWMKKEFILISSIIMAFFLAINFIWFYTDNMVMNVSITLVHFIVSLSLPFVWIESEVLVKNTLYNAEVELRFKLGLEKINANNLEEFCAVNKIKEDTIFYKN